MGKCYTFNAEANVTPRQSVTGAGNGLKLVLNTRHWKYTEAALSARMEAGIRFEVILRRVKLCEYLFE